MLDQQHEPKGHGKCCKYSKKLQYLTDTSILTMICKHIYQLTRNRSNDNPFLAYNRPFNCQHFQPATASRVCERDRSALEKVNAPEGKWEIVTIFLRGSKTNIWFFLHIVFPEQLLNYRNCHFWCRFMQSKTFPVPDVNLAVVISESHLTSFPRTDV